jgi:hypothetical protein
MFLQQVTAVVMEGEVTEGEVWVMVEGEVTEEDVTTV